VKLLITNDDGIDSPGLHALVEALARRSDQLLVVAPERDASGSGSALGLIEPAQEIALRPGSVPVGGVEAHALSGPPGLAVVAACFGAFGDPPDLVVSGINAGLNLGRAVLHSGTVGAALTAQNFGVSALAVSLAEHDPWEWGNAAAMAAGLIDWVGGEPAGTVLNFNVPATPAGVIPELRWAKLARFGTVRTGASHADGRLQFRIEESAEQPDPESDVGLVRAGWATLTRLAGVVEGDVDGRPVPTLRLESAPG
jgi:5'-nucleotidase